MGAGHETNTFTIPGQAGIRVEWGKNDAGLEKRGVGLINDGPVELFQVDFCGFQV